MSFAFDSDIPLMMAEFGSPISIGSTAGVGIVDAIEEEIETSETAGYGTTVLAATKVTIQTSAFPAARIDDAIVVNGTSYSIRARKRIEDGALTEILLGFPLTTHTFFFGFPFSA